MEFGKYIRDDFIRKILEESPNPMMVSSFSEGRILDVNKAFIQNLGYDREEVVGKTVSELKLYESPEIRDEMIAELRRDGFSQSKQINYRVKEGELVPCKLTFRLIDYLGEKCIFSEVNSLGVLKDIYSDLKRKSAIVDSTTDSVITTDLDGKITSWNRGAENLFGYVADEVLGRSVSLLWREEDLPKLRMVIDSLLSGRDIGFFEASLVNKEGGELDLLTSFSVIKKDNGQIVELLGVSKDISLIRKAQKELGKEQEKFKLYMDVSRTIFVAIDKVGKVSYVNPVFCEILGYELKEVIGLDWFENFVPERLRDEIRGVSEKIISGDIEPVEYYENFLLTKYGEEKIFAWHNTLLKNDDGKITGHLSSGEEITEKKAAEMMLKESEEKFRSVAENLQEGLWITDSEDKLIYFNLKMEEIAGAKSNDVIGLSVTKDFPSETSGHFLPYFHEAKKTRKPVTYEADVVTPGGKKMIQSGWLIPRYENEKYIGMICTIEDITEKKDALEKLKESEEKYRALLDDSGLGIGYYDLDGKILFMNKKGGDYLKRETKDVIGKSAKEIFGDEMGQTILDRINEVIKLERPLTFYDEVELPSGNKWFTSTYSKIYNNEGEIDGIQIISSDTTEKKKSEEKLRESEAKYRSIIENSGEVHYIHDTDDNILYISHQCIDYFGYSPEEMKKRWTETLTDNPINQEGIECTKRAIKMGVKQPNYELELNRKDGTTFWVEVNESPVIDDNGKVVALTGTLRDITEKKKAEEKINKSRKILTSVVDSASDMIFSVDSQGYVTSWNSSAEYLTGYRSWEVLDKKVSDLGFFECGSHIHELLEDESVLDLIVDCEVKSRYGRVRKLSFTVSGLEIDSEGGLVFIGHEISSRKNYSLDFGKAYLLKDSSDVYKKYLDAIVQGYSSFFVSRNVPMQVQNEMSKGKIDVLLLKENNIVNLEILFEEIKKNIGLKNDCVIFLDRIDYLITLYGFRSFLRFLYRLNDYVSNSRYILLVNANSSLLEVSEMAYLEQELLSFPVADLSGDVFDSALVEILRFISNNRKKNISTSFKDIRNHFEISNVTTRKRILDLMGRGLVEIIKSGRLKFIELTEAGIGAISGD